MPTNNTKHTPLPWNVPEVTDRRHRCVVIMSESGAKQDNGPAQVACCYVNHVDFEGAKANAEFITRACNSHEELLAALRNLEIAGGCFCGTGIPNDMHAMFCRKARTAIAKAEGKGVNS